MNKSANSECTEPGCSSVSEYQSAELVTEQVEAAEVEADISRTQTGHLPPHLNDS